MSRTREATARCNATAAVVEGLINASTSHEARTIFVLPTLKLQTDADLVDILDNASLICAMQLSIAEISGTAGAAWTFGAEGATATGLATFSSFLAGAATG